MDRTSSSGDENAGSIPARCVLVIRRDPAQLGGFLMTLADATNEVRFKCV